MPAQPAVSFLCPACQTPLPAAPEGAPALRCPACEVEVDIARLETVVGKPRFVAERSWTGTELPGLVVEEVIGAGGMGTVYRARSTQAGEGRLAVKFLSPGLAGEPEIVARFWREVALLEKLDHPAIVKVKSHGERDGLPWFAMELVEGPTLGVRLAKGPLAVDEARTIFDRLLTALAHAHDLGVVHRDLKPANVLLAADGARLADFGIARLDMTVLPRKTQLTRTDAIIGTFPYMSPEQRTGRPVDARSDLYSVGVMLYEALAGERPEGAFPALHRRRVEVPARLDAVVRRLLQPEPGARFASAAETRRALQAALAVPRLARRPLVWVAAAAVALVAVVGLASRDTPVPALPISKSEPRKAVVVPLPDAAPSQGAMVQRVEPPVRPTDELDQTQQSEQPGGKLARGTKVARYRDMKAMADRKYQKQQLGPKDAFKRRPAVVPLQTKTASKPTLKTNALPAPTKPAGEQAVAPQAQVPVLGGKGKKKASLGPMKGGNDLFGSSPSRK